MSCDKMISAAVSFNTADPWIHLFKPKDFICLRGVEVSDIGVLAIDANGIPSMDAESSISEEQTAGDPYSRTLRIWDRRGTGKAQENVNCMEQGRLLFEMTCTIGL